MYSLFIILYISIVTGDVNLSSEMETNEEVDLPTAFNILNILKEKYPYSFTVFVSNLTTTKDLIFLKELHLVSDYIITNEINFFNFSENCILVLSHSYELENITNKFFIFKYQVCYFTFIYIFEEEVMNPNVLLNLIFDENVSSIICTFNHKLDEVFVYLPFFHGRPSAPLPQESYTKDNLSELKKLMDDNYLKLYKLPMKISIFPKRYTAVLENDKWEGFDGKIIDLLETNLNLTKIFVVGDKTMRYGYQLENGTFVGSLGDIIHDNADFCANSLFIKDYGSSDIQFTNTVMFDALCVAVPSSTAVPRWKVIFLCYDKTTWIFIFFTYSFSAIIWNVFLQFNPDDGKQPLDFSNTAISIFKIIILSSVILPSRTSGRIFILTLILSSFVLATCFEGSLLALLTRTIYESEIDTIEELDKSHLPIYTLSKNLVNDTFDRSNEQKNQLANKVKIYPNFTQDLVKLIHKSKNLSCLGRKSDLIRRIGETESYSERPSVHVVKDCPRTYFLAYIMKKRNPFHPLVNEILGRLVSFGIIKSPKVSSGYDNYIYNNKKYDNTFSPNPLEMKNLVISFLILLFGYLISFIVFIVELFFCKYL